MSMPWKEPNADDVKKFMLSAVVDRAAQDERQIPGLLQLVVARIRGTIAAANVTPVSGNENEVPPEGWQHSLVLTVFELLSASPGFGNLLMKGDGGSETSFAYSVKRAEAWLERVAEGNPVTYPSNPADAGNGLVRWGSDTLVVTEVL